MELGAERPPRHIGSPALTTVSLGIESANTLLSSGKTQLSNASMSMRRTSWPSGATMAIRVPAMVSRRIPRCPIAIQPRGWSKRLSALLTSIWLESVEYSETADQFAGSSKAILVLLRAPFSVRVLALGMMSSARKMPHWLSSSAS